MRVLLTRRAGQAGTKKLLQEYGEDLVCVRYRYDDARRERVKTAEIVVSRVEWVPRRRPPDSKSEPVEFRIEPHEDLLRRAVMFAGGRWNETTDRWSLPRASATALGLTPRLLRRRQRR